MTPRLPQSLNAASANTDAAIDSCRRLCRKRARNFYYGLKLSPEPQRSALYVLYAWMRQADDLVDSSTPNTVTEVMNRIEQFREETRAALNGHPASEEFLWVALASIAERFHLPQAHFHDMLDGQIADLSHAPFATFMALREYCRRVASTVGLLCIEIWGYGDATARELAIDRGIAFQLTNILRDYSQDLDGGRVYLPVEDFAHFAISPHDLRHWKQPAACLAMMQHQVQRAEALYQRSASLEELISPPCRPTLWAMTSIYHALLRKIERSPAQVMVGKRIRLSALHKATIALRAKWATRSRLHPAPTPTPVPQRVRGNVTIP